LAEKVSNKKTDAGGSRAKKIFQRNFPLYVLMLPAILTTFLFDYVTLYGIQIAFRQFRTMHGIWGSQWVGLQHFVRFINYPNFWPLIRNTLTITTYTLLTFPIGVILALMLNEIRHNKYKKTIQMVSYAPYFLSTVVLVAMINLFLGRAHGLVNNVIEIMGGTRIDFLSIPRYFASIFVWSGVWASAGWSTIIFLAALSAVSPELIEAARIDGANRIHIIRHVNIPAILPTVIILFILATGSILSLGFERIFLMQNPLNMPASNVISVHIYRRGLLGGEFSYTTAVSLFNNVINLIVILGVNKIAAKVSGVGLW